MIQLEQGDCLEVLQQLDENSVDSLVTGPPAGVFFMGRSWDNDKGGRDEWVAWFESIMVEALRVLKPGGHGLVWSLPRTSHWTAWALETARFEIRDSTVHVRGQGMVKGFDISKAIDKLLDAERETSAPATPEAAQWAGWDAHQKPAQE
ncbi:MAG: site-specific DNA-methyltransferase, partial [Planctomycetota bacterium]